MISVDITLTQQSNNFSVNECNIPFVDLMMVEAQNINAIKNFLMAYDTNSWLVTANENVLKTMMSWKDNK